MRLFTSNPNRAASCLSRSCSSSGNRSVVAFLAPAPRRGFSFGIPSPPLHAAPLDREGGCPTGCFSLKNRHNDLIPANLVPAMAVPFKWHLLAVLPPFVRDSPLFVDLVLQTDVLQHQVYLAR